MSPPESEFLSSDQFWFGLNLNDAKYKRLSYLARRFCRSRRFTPKDLLNQALLRIVDADSELYRPCPRGLSPVWHLANVMRNIASNDSRRKDLEDLLDGTEPLSRDGSTEEVTAARERLNTYVGVLIAELNRDQEALSVLKCRCFEMTKTEIKLQYVWTDIQYATVTRRIRRAINRLPEEYREF